MICDGCELGAGALSVQLLRIRFTFLEAQLDHDYLPKSIVYALQNSRNRSADPPRARPESRSGTDATRELCKATARRAQHAIAGGDQSRDWR